jgi:hypothetical protein
MIMWLVFSKYKAKKKEADEMRVEREVSFPNFVEWV